MLTGIAAASLALWSVTHARLAATFIVASLAIEFALQVRHIWVGRFLGLCVLPAERSFLLVYHSCTPMQRIIDALAPAMVHSGAHRAEDSMVTRPQDAATWGPFGVAARNEPRY